MISVVVPVRDEEESLATLHGELSAVFAALGPEPSPVEFIFVDDGSRDGTWGALSALARLDPQGSAIRFRRNFGKAAALMAAFQQARGDLVFTLDGDLQDDPAEIPLFLAQLETGYDVVSGWKKTRHDPWHKVYPSRVFNWMVSRLTGCHLHDHNCGFKLYRRQVLREIDIYGELHRFIPVLAYARGFKVGEVEVRHRRRRHGASKYGFSRFFKGLARPPDRSLPDPLQPAASPRPGGRRPGAVRPGKPGHALSGRSSGSIRRNQPIGDRPLLLYSIAILIVGVQLVSLGILAELVTAYNFRAEDTYSIAETIPAQEESPVATRAAEDHSGPGSLTSES